MTFDFTFTRRQKTKKTSKWTYCLVKPNNKKHVLEIQQNAKSLIRKNFEDCVAIIGTPGAGKSTLASTIYNIMRNTKYEYFSVGHKTINTHTRGIWTLNQETKILQSNLDKIDVIDCEGLDDKDTIHYLVVVALVLSKAVIIPSRDGRFAFKVFSTVQAGLKLFEKYHLQIPKPVIFMQAPSDQETIVVTSEDDDDEEIEFDAKLLPNYVKHQFPFFKNITIKTFKLPEFTNGRFDNNYKRAVLSLINQLIKVKTPNDIKIQTRWMYVETVIKALNSKSPEMVLNLNKKFYQDELNKYIEDIKKDKIVTIRSEYELLQLHKKVSLDEYVNLNNKCSNGKYYYYKDILNVCTNLPFYDAKNNGITNLIRNLSNRKLSYYYEPKFFVKDLYSQAISALKRSLIAKRDQQKTIDNSYFENFVKNTLSDEINKIDFYGSTYLSYGVKSKIEKEKHRLKSKLLNQTQKLVELPPGYLDINVDDLWQSKIQTLKDRWNSQISTALRRRYYVKTHGDGTCPSCSKKHNDGVGHKECGDNALWMWVNSKTSHCVCDHCRKVQVITYVVCWSCSTRLRSKITAVNYP